MRRSEDESEDEKEQIGLPEHMFKWSYCCSTGNIFLILYAIGSACLFIFGIAPYLPLIHLIWISILLSIAIIVAMCNLHCLFWNDPGVNEPYTCENPPEEAKGSSRHNNIIRSDGWSYCVRCESWRPPKSHHCSVCKQCVREFDHHCGVIGRCVAEKNHRYFTSLFCACGFGNLMLIISIAVIILNSSNAFNGWLYFIGFMCVYMCMSGCVVGLIQIQSMIELSYGRFPHIPRIIRESGDRRHNNNQPIYTWNTFKVAMKLLWIKCFYPEELHDHFGDDDNNNNNHDDDDDNHRIGEVLIQSNNHNNHHNELLNEEFTVSV